MSLRTDPSVEGDTRRDTGQAILRLQSGELQHGEQIMTLCFMVVLAQNLGCGVKRASVVPRVICVHTGPMLFQDGLWITS